MAAHSKRYRQATALVDRTRRYSVEEAVGLLKQFPSPKFSETVEVALKLGIDPRQSDQMVRGSVSLPHGIGKDVRVIAFCDGATAEQAREAGAVEAGGEELVKKIQDGWSDFDVAVAEPKMMRLVGQLGRILGPQGKMPSPKSGTVTPEVVAAVSDFKAGRIEYRADNTGNLHAPVGRMDFEDARLTENITSFIGHIRSARPASVKGAFIEAAYITSTMNPGIKLAV